MSSHDKPWDRPWSMEQIISNSDGWNLAGDVALLNTIKAFADSLLSRTNDIHSHLQALTGDLDETSLQLDIAQNEFQGLRNTQFIESRVYEDDESLPKEANKPKEEEKSDHTEDVKLAAMKGLEMLDKYFDKVVVSVSDSEDDDIDLPNYVLRPKDLYIQRPLPYVIGSEEWHKNLHVGLEDSSSDSETEKVSDKFSESDSESDLPIIQDRSQIKGTSDTSSEFDFSQKTDTKVKDFANSSDSENSAPATSNPNFAEQLAAKLGTVIQDYEPEVNTRPIQPPRINYGDVFFDEPPPLDEPKGLFSGGGGLFDDEDEKFAPKVSATKGLFDGGDSDEDISAKGAPPAKAPLFSEEPPVLDEKKKPVGGVSIFGGGNIFDKKMLKRQQSSSEEEAQVKIEEKKHKIDLFGDDDLFKNSSKSEDRSSKIGTAGGTIAKTVNLFDSDEEEKEKNIFVEKKVEKGENKPEVKTETGEQNQAKIKIKTEADKKMALFDDDDLFKDDLFSANTKKTFTSGLFDDIPEDDLFGTPKLSAPLFADLDMPDDKNSINSEDDKGAGDGGKGMLASPPPSDFRSSTPHATPSMRLFDPSPPPDDEWDSKSENVESPFENDDVSGDFPEDKVEKSSLFSEEPPSLDFAPSPKKPGKLKHNLNINVGALMPGSAPPKRAERTPPVTSPVDVPKRSPPPAVPVTPPSQVPVTPPNEVPVTSFDEADHVQVLQSVTKDRAKVPLRRHPSTRRGRKAALRNSMTDFKLDPDGEDNEALNAEEKHVEDVKLFDESSESEDLFTNLEKVGRNLAQEPEGLPKILSENLFSSMNVPKSSDLFGLKHDDIFDTSSQEPPSDLFGSKLTKSDDLFASINDDDLFTQARSKKDERNVEKTQRVPKDRNLFENMPKNPQRSEELKSEDAQSKSRIFDELLKISQKDNSGETSQKTQEDRDLFQTKSEERKSESSRSKSLFDELSKNSQKDDFGETSHKTQADPLFQTKPEERRSESGRTSSLFDEPSKKSQKGDSGETSRKTAAHQGLFQTKTEERKSESSRSSSLFDGISKTSQNENARETSQNIPKDQDLFRDMPKAEEVKPESHSKISLFDDDDDDGGLFTTKKSKQSTKIKKALFDDDDDDDIFKSFSSTSVKKTETRVAKEKKIPKLSSVKKLENTKPDDDPLSALLK